jgi:hypothetical protein
MLSRILVYALSGIVLAMAALHVSGAGPRIDVILPPQSIVHQEGQRYLAPLPISRVLAAVVAYDSMFDFGGSRASLKEDGVDIGRAHSDHAGIARDGGGRFSHWGHPLGQRIYLSSSDGSDPRSNGRVYAVELQVLPPVWLLVVAGGLLAWLGTRAAAPWIVPAAVLASIGLGAAWVSLFWGSVLISPDSAAYITFHPWYPLGYPTFILIVSRTIGYLALPAVQLLLLILSSGFLSLSIAKIAKSRIVGALSFFAFLSYAPLLMYSGYVLSETLYAALLFGFLGFGIRLLVRFRPIDAVAFALIAVTAWAVRPSGTFLLLVIAYVAVLIMPQVRLKAIIAWMVIPTVAATGLVLVAHHLVRGPGPPSQAGRILFGQVAFLFDPADTAPEDRRVAEAIGESLAPHRAEFEAQGSWRDRHSFATNNYSQRVTDVDRILYSGENLSFVDGEAILMKFSRIAIQNNILLYAQWVAEDIIWAWLTKVLYSIRIGPENAFSEYSLTEADRSELIERFDLTLTEDQVSVDDRAASGPAGQFIDLVRRCLALVFTLPGLVPVLGVLLLVAAVVGPFSSSILLRTLGLIGATVHLSVAMTSAATLFLVRYALPTDPLVIVGLILMIHGVLEWLRQRRRQDQPGGAGVGEAPAPQAS